MPIVRRALALLILNVLDARPLLSIYSRIPSIAILPVYRIIIQI